MSPHTDRLFAEAFAQAALTPEDGPAPRTPEAGPPVRTPEAQPVRTPEACPTRTPEQGVPRHVRRAP